MLVREQAPAHKYLRRIQGLANDLIKGLPSGDALWQFQLDLLDLQRTVQDRIATEKAIPKRDRNATALEALRLARWNARHLGDAFAWLILGLDRQFIMSLGENARVPIGPDEHGSKGVVGIAGGLANKGWGFPLLHDVTDCLRIGDITFVRPDQEPRHVTVEVKTQLMSETKNADGTTTGEYRIRVHSHTAIDPESGAVLREPDFRTRPDWKPKNRSDRQAIRMWDAKVKGSAGDGLVEGLAEPLLNLSPTIEAETQWQVLRRLIRAARREGFAGSVVDGAFYYAVFYAPTGVTEETISNEHFPSHMVDSDFLESRVKAERALVINQVPETRGNDPYEALPYFLYSVPRRAVFEILRGELVIVIVVNPGRVCDALRDAGLQLQMARRGGGGPPEITVIDHFEIDGVPMESRYPGVWRAVRQAILDFRSMDHVTQLILHVSDEARRHAMAHYPRERLTAESRNAESQEP